MNIPMKLIPGGQGGPATGNVTDAYGFDPTFERALAYLICNNRDVFSRIGTYLEPKALKATEAQWLIKAAQAIGSEMGEGPSSDLIVAQRLRAWREAGKLTYEAVLAATDYLEEAINEGLPNIEELINETSVVLKKRARFEKAKAVTSMVAKPDANFAKIGQELAAIDRIGAIKTTMGETVHDNIIDEIVAANAAAKFPTGCLELDHITGGGLPVGYTLFLGREKSGKSMVLSSIAAHAYFHGKNVAIATLELATKKQIERVLANILACTLNEVQTGAPIVRARLDRVKHRLGRLSVSRFSPDTPVHEITNWVERLQTQWGAKIDLLVVDYADLVGSGKSSKDENDYKAAKVVGNAFRDHAVLNDYTAISASQARRSSGTGGRALDMDDASESMHKVRLADLVIAMRMEQDQKDLVDWYIILNRDGTDRVGTGQLPTDRSMARMFPVSRDEPW
jgi:replicative DNA helicase